MYEKQDNKEAKTNIYKIAEIRERKCRDLYIVNFVKDENQRVLLETKRLKKDENYFDRLYNISFMQDLGDLTSQCEDMNHTSMLRIKKN